MEVLLLGGTGAMGVPLIKTFPIYDTIQSA